MPYAVCGGIAVTIHGATRTTKDIDVLVACADLPRALGAVRHAGYTFAALPMEAARARLARDERAPVPFGQSVGGRLSELRALYDLTLYLQRSEGARRNHRT